MRKKEARVRKIKRDRLFNKAAGIFALCGFFICNLFCLVLAQDEQLTITTYYPTPYGVYRILKLQPHDDFTPADSCVGKEGEMYYDQSDDKLYICYGSPPKWQAAIGTAGAEYWAFTDEIGSFNFVSQAGVPYAPRFHKDTYNLNSGNVYIGVDSPSPALGGLSGYLQANDVQLSYIGGSAKEGFWRAGKEIVTANNIYQNRERVYIGAIKGDRSPAQWTVKDTNAGLGDSLLHIKNASGSSLLLVRDDGNVGIGTNSPLAKLDIRGRVRLVDNAQATGRVLTSDYNGIARWQTSLPAVLPPGPEQTGLYGWCRFNSNANDEKKCGTGVAGNEPKSPAECIYDASGNFLGYSSMPNSGRYRCCCPDADYTIVQVGSDGGNPDYYSCYRK